MRKIVVVSLLVLIGGCHVHVTVTHVNEPAPEVGCMTDSECEAQNPDDARPTGFLSEV